MDEKEIATLATKSIEMLIAVFQCDTITLEDYIFNTTQKLRFLETYISKMSDDKLNEKASIQEIIARSKKIIGSKTTACSTQL